MSKLNYKYIEEKISSLSEKESISKTDLDFNGENILDVVLNMPNKGVIKPSLLSDLIMLDVDNGRNDEFFYTKLLETNNIDLVEMIIDKNPEDNKLGLNLLKASLSEEVDSSIFRYLSRKFNNDIIENKSELLDSVLSIKQTKNTNDDKIFMLLLVNHEDKNDFVLENIVKNTNPKVLKILLSSKLNFNKINNKNETLLFYVDGHNKEEINTKAKLLIESGVDKDVLNIDGLTAFEANNALKEEVLKKGLKNKKSLSI